jgi:outer membrane immunogenic protein
VKTVREVESVEMMMRTKIGALFSLGFSALAAIGPAEAADMSAPAYKAAPAPAFSWSGFYVGGTVGGGMASLPVNDIDNFLEDTVAGPSLKSLGAVGGLHAGYNWQLSPSFLFGLEGDFNWSSFKANDTTCFGDCVGRNTDDPLTASSKLDAFSTFRARFGLTSDHTLVYVTAGPAWGHINASETFLNCSTCTNPGAINSIASDSSFHMGVAIGGGVEYALTTNWILRGEYLHLDFANKDTLWKDATGVPITGFDNVTTFRVRSSATADIARLGISYKFW